MSTSSEAAPVTTGEGARPHFSVIIPAYNEEQYLPVLFETLDTAMNTYRGGRDAFEIIVGDNCSTDNTAQVARDFGAKVVRVEKRVIAANRNGAAKEATGEIFCFIDADLQVHPNVFNAIDDRLATGKYSVGVTGVKFSRMSLPLFITWCITTPLKWLAQFDLGVMFCTKEDFEAIGGFNEDKLFGEDTQFLYDLRMLGKPRGQKFIRYTEARSILSMRKMEKHGDWHFFTLTWTTLRALSKKDKAQQQKELDEIAQRYWYDNPR